ncbi:hypothetical protein [Thiohalobacter thiocyanaticus]|uniref:hypothetical protein n=1 Tax=Thiohalobacter thiocyanaticus TaxID=585455 RepID=UPI000F632503|nr:hypothetical protein [Thiohalobacter thiocyanaticus]
MKIGKAEGTPEEIKDFFENYGLNPEDYFEKTESPLHWKWIAIPGSIVAVSALLLVFLDTVTPKTHILLFSGRCGLCVLVSSVFTDQVQKWMGNHCSRSWRTIGIASGSGLYHTEGDRRCNQGLQR